MYDESLGRLHAWWMFLGFNAVFLSMFWSGVNGMNRRIGTYSASLGGMNRFTSIAAFVLGASFLVFVWNMLKSARRGEPAGANPWNARTLEWQVPSPPPLHNFPGVVEVVGHPYDYGRAGSTHARFTGNGHGNGHGELELTETARSGEGR
jgi:cytochrome c oxidase subunit 1